MQIQVLWLITPYGDENSIVSGKSFLVEDLSVESNSALDIDRALREKKLFLSRTQGAIVLPTQYLLLPEDKPSERLALEESVDNTA